MGIFDERKAVAEKEFVINLERTQQIRAKRDRMLARWVCDLTKRRDFDAYLDMIIKLPGEEDVFRRVWADLLAAGSTIDEDSLRTKMRHFLLEATRAVENG